MTFLPLSVRRAWEDRGGRPAILATVGTDGAPNLVCVTCVTLFGEHWVVVADNYSSTTPKARCLTT
jgi:hypothetical protein